MNTSYREYSGLNLPGIEEEILQKWTNESAFEKSVSLGEGAVPFVFYEGPPSANGMPGIHHVISRTLKDMVCRYKTMQGFQVKRKGGWDTHGLPVELGVEKELGITKEDIGTKISVEDYNKKCQEAVLRYKKEWDQITNQMGYWVDLHQPYITFEASYIESLWWLLQQFYKKGLLYQSVSIQPYSPAAGTGLSSHELNQPGTYKDVKDTSAVVMFRAVQDERNHFLHEPVQGAEVFFLAWTTTPWTLPSNLGLTVGPNIEYSLVKTFNPYTHLPIQIILATALLHKYFKDEDKDLSLDSYDPASKSLPWQVVTTFTGQQLEGCRYEQLLPFEANAAQLSGGDPFRILLGDFVTTEDGTGIVHTAPAFGADDYKVGKEYGIGILTLVDREGKFVDGLGEFSGRFVKNYKDDPNYVDVNVDICVKLKKENRAFKVEKYEHSYPHCWRTDKPILYYPLDAWFIRTTALKDKMVEANQRILWKPKSTGEGRFGNWLENMVDWNLSRSRYWGTPLPIWRTEDGSEEVCIGSVAELMEAAKVSVAKGFMSALPFDGDAANANLHKPYVDDIVLVSPSGQPMKRVPDLVDVWFDSGAMPYAQWHFPFENREIFASNYPADFIAEGVDQTRGWFYTLHAIACLAEDVIKEELEKWGLDSSKVDGRAYKAVVSNGLVLDKNGNKMSKRLGNVVNPFETINKFGADATRWYLITNASPWDNLTKQASLTYKGFSQGSFNDLGDYTNPSIGLLMDDLAIIIIELEVRIITELHLERSINSGLDIPTYNTSIEVVILNPLFQLLLLIPTITQPGSTNDIGRHFDDLSHGLTLLITYKVLDDVITTKMLTRIKHYLAATIYEDITAVGEDTVLRGTTILLSIRLRDVDHLHTDMQCRGESIPFSSN